VQAVSVSGLAVLAYQIAVLDLGDALDPPSIVVSFVAFVLVSQFFPINVPHRTETYALTITATFAFALVLQAGTPLAVLALVTASVLSDLVARVRIDKVIFNLGQYTLSLSAAGALYEVFGGGQGPVTAHLVPAFLAAVVWFLLNYALVQVAIALAEGSSVLGSVRRDFVLNAWSSGILLSMAPAVVILAHHSVLLVFTIIAPIAGVYLAAKAAAAANERRAEAEQAAEAARRLAVEQGRLASAEQALVRELQEADRIKSELLARVSHELRSPLTTILGALGTVAAHDARLEPEDRQALIQMCTRQGERLKQLIEQLLQAAHPEEPVIGAPGAPERPLVDAVEQVLEAVAEAVRRDATRRVEVDAGERLPVRAEPEAVRQVLSSLIDNACRHSPPGEPVQVTAASRGELAVLAVRDAGSGIACPDQQRVFERFTQLEDDEGMRSGVGLGLYLARQIARRQGGEVLVAETGASGTRFEFRLPLAPLDEQGAVLVEETEAALARHPGLGPAARAS